MGENGRELEQGTSRPPQPCPRLCSSGSGTGLTLASGKQNWVLPRYCHFLAVVLGQDPPCPSESCILINVKGEYMFVLRDLLRMKNNINHVTFFLKRADARQVRVEMVNKICLFVFLGTGAIFSLLLFFHFETIH